MSSPQFSVSSPPPWEKKPSRLVRAWRGFRKRPFTYMLSPVFLGLIVFDRWNDAVLVRSMRTAWAGARIILLYKYTEPESLEELRDLNIRASSLIVRTCMANEGLYIKFGQALSTMNQFMPPEFCKELKVLLDNAPEVPRSDILRIIKEDTGKDPHELFEQFDEKPVASASIAQVHKAKLRRADGSLMDVAVKVQKPKIRNQIWWDLTAHTILCYALQYFFELPTVWSAETIKINLSREINFEKEAEYLRLARKIFVGKGTSGADAGMIEKKPSKTAHIFVPSAAEPKREERTVDSWPTPRDDVYVPEVCEEVLTQRVLVTEWMNATKLGAVDDVKKNFDSTAVMRTTLEAFGDMIFKHGIVHCDPHPANLLVRHAPTGNDSLDSRGILKSDGRSWLDVFLGRKPKQQVVMLDFGLSIYESDAFRESYARLFKAIFMRDMPTLERIVKSWGVSNAELFASIQLSKPFSVKEPMHKAQVTKKEVTEFQRKMKKSIRTLLEDDKKMPRELVFIGRCMNLLRGLNKSYGAPVNRANILAERAVDSLVTATAGSGVFWPLWYCVGKIGQWRYYSTLALLSLVHHWMLWSAWITHLLTGSEKMGSNLEEVLEQQEKRAISKHMHIANIATND